MKTKLGFLIIFIFVVISYANGQFFKASIKNGFIVLANGDTLKGQLYFNGDYDNFWRIVFKDTVTNKKTTYTPQETKCYSVDSVYFYPKFLKKQWVFMGLLFNGDLKVYIYRYYMATGYTSGTETAYLYEKPNGQYLQVVWHRMYPFKKNVSEFFSDYPELSQKILQKEYKMEDIFLIAAEYDNWLKNKK